MTASLMSGTALHMSTPKRQKSLSPDELRGARLAAARRLTGLTQLQMADKLGVSRTTVTGWEGGSAIDEARMDDVSVAYRASKGWIRYAEGKPPEGLASFEPMVLTNPEYESSTRRRKRNG